MKLKRNYNDTGVRSKYKNVGKTKACISAITEDELIANDSEQSWPLENSIRRSTIPEQVTPSPENPWRQVHLKKPTMLSHRALE